jgi:L-alanine-DL-glutamate epimerase-like enolase superfamily enzyme
MLPDIAAYVEFVGQMRDLGYHAVKLHTWCVPERDLPMARAVRQAFPELRAARELEELSFRWFEAPLPDFDLEGYRLLRRHASVPIIPAGNWLTDPRMLAEAVRSGAWDALRVDAAVAGGVSGARDACVLARAFGTTCEPQCWGYTLSQAANLHVMLGDPGVDYFEQPVPLDQFEYGMHDVIRVDQEGYVHAPPGPGLGVAIDWEAMRAATVLRLDSRDG